MREVTLYEYKLTGNGGVLINAGGHMLQVAFRWPIVYQDQYDNLVTRLKNMATADPLIFEGTYIRDYDWLEFYMNAPDFGDGLEEWWSTLQYVPQSLNGIADVAAYQLIRERKALATDLSQYKNEIAELLCWTCSITDETDAVTVTSVRPGGWYRWQDASWAMRFVADIATIGYNDLDKVTMEIESYEFI